MHPADSPVHGNANGAYLVDMTWFSAFYRQPPEGKVLPIETTYTPEQLVRIGVGAGVVEFLDELYQIDRVLKNIR